MSGLQLSMEIKGLDTLARNFSRHPSVVQSELRTAESKGLTVLRDEARHLAQEIAVDGRLPGSVTLETISGGLQGRVGSIAKTALSIEQGRKPGERPSAGLIAGWVARKGLAGETMSVATHRRKKSSAAVRSAERELAWKIVAAIEKRGTKPLPFIVPAARNKATAVQALFQEAAKRIVQRVARG